MGKLKEHWKVAVLVVVAAGALGVGGYYAWLSTPPPMPTTPEEAVALLKSDRFKALSKAEKRDYHDRIAEVIGPLDPEKRRELMRDRDARSASRNMMRDMMFQRAAAYAMADETEKQRLVAEAREMMKAWGGRGGPPRGNQANSTSSQTNQVRGERPDPESMTEEERAEYEAKREERRERFKKRIEDWVKEGNGQEHALMKEYFHAIRDGWEDAPTRPDAPTGKPVRRMPATTLHVTRPTLLA